MGKLTMVDLERGTLFTAKMNFSAWTYRANKYRILKERSPSKKSVYYIILTTRKISER